MNRTIERAVREIEREIARLQQALSILQVCRGHVVDVG